MPFGCLIAHCTTNYNQSLPLVFFILLAKFRGYKLLSTLLGAHFSSFLKQNPMPYVKGTNKPNHHTFGCLQCIYNACTHPIISSNHTHTYAWLVSQKQVIKEQDSTLGLKETKNVLKFSICDQVKSSIRKNSVPRTLY